MSARFRIWIKFKCELVEKKEKRKKLAILTEVNGTIMKFNCETSRKKPGAFYYSLEIEENVLEKTISCNCNVCAPCEMIW